MANYRLISNPVIHIDDDNGVPLAGGTLKAYDSGTSTPKAFYLDVNGTSSATETTLDARGEAIIYGTGTYKLEIYDADDVLVITIDPYTIMPVSNWAQDFLTKTTASAARTKLGIGSAYTLDAGSNAGDLVQLDTTGKIPAYDGSQITNLTDTQVYNLPRGWISGLNITTGTNTVAVAIGEARDSTNSADIKLVTSFTKTIQASGDWAVETGNGLDSGVIEADTWYHVFVIKNDSTGNGDILISKSRTSPSMPSGYTYFRRIASLRTDSTPEIIRVFNNGDDFYYVAPPIDINASGSTNVSSTPTTKTLSYVPTGIRVYAKMRFLISSNVSNANIAAIIYPVDCNDPTDTPGFLDGAHETTLPDANLVTLYQDAYQTIQNIAGEISILTNTSAQFKVATYALGSADSNACFHVVTTGWTDSRGKDD